MKDVMSMELPRSRPADTSGNAPRGDDHPREDQYYRALARSIPNGAVYVFNDELRFVLAGGSDVIIRGVRNNQLTGRHIRQLFDSTTFELLEPHFQNALVGLTSSAEYTLGDQVYLVRIAPARGDGGRIIGGVALTENVTQQRRIEADLRRQVEAEQISAEVSCLVAEARPGDFAHAAHETLARVSAFLNTDFASLIMLDDNPVRIRSTTQWARDDAHLVPIDGSIVGQLGWAAHRDRRHGVLRVDDSRELRSGSKTEKEYCYFQGAVSLLAMPIHDGDAIAAVLNTGTLTQSRGWSEGDAHFLSSIAQTITYAITKSRALEEQSRLDARQRQSQKLGSLDLLTTGVAHDFESLLTEVIGNAERALADIPVDSLGYSEIVQTVRTAHLGADLAKQMLVWSGEARIVTEDVDLNVLVGEVKGLAIELVPERASLELALSKTPVRVHADASQITRVVTSLVSNAAEAVEESGDLIIISTGILEGDSEYLGRCYACDNLRPGTYAYVRVLDNGAGIDDELKSRIFDPFFTTKARGRGLGLTAALGIARAHRGGIVVSSARGSGSVFTVLLPAERASAPQRGGHGDSMASEVGRLSRTVLLVDDERMVRDVGRRILERIGYKVIMASSGEEALEFIAKGDSRIDCVLLDLTMPVMDGRETLKRIREARPGLPVVIATGHTAQEAFDDSPDVTPNGFIQKPYRMALLSDKLHEVMAT